jgi:hypothetical protein
LTEAELRRLRDSLDECRTLDEWAAWFDEHCNPIHELKRQDGSPERREWPRTPYWRDLLIAGWPIVLVGLVALMGWVALGVAIYRGWVNP